MITFWLAVAALVALTSAIVLLPLLRSGGAAPTSEPPRAHLAIHRDRLVELDGDYRAGRIDEPTYRQMLAELEQNLAREMSLVEAESRRGSKATLAWTVGIALAMTLPLGALYYYYVNALSGQAMAWISAQQRLGEVVERSIYRPDDLPPAALEDPFNFTRVLQAKVLRQGKTDPEALYLLGMSYLQLRQPEPASQALGKALALQPDDSAIQLAYAQSLLLSNEGRLTAESERLLRAVLTNEPQHQGAMMMLGFGAFNAGRYELAIAMWEPLLALRSDAQSEGAQALRGALARARQLAGVEATAASDAAALPEVAVAADSNTAAASVKLVVTVDVAAELADQFGADDTLFVFAKAAEGPPMPLAVVRQAAQNFPVEVVLSDAEAMVPAFKLSAFPEVVVEARISKSGDVTPSPGDLEGTTQPVTVGAEPQAISLIIDRTI